jgi:hypothetical protein
MIKMFNSKNETQHVTKDSQINEKFHFGARGICKYFDVNTLKQLNLIFRTWSMMVDMV